MSETPLADEIAAQLAMTDPSDTVVTLVAEEIGKLWQAIEAVHARLDGLAPRPPIVSGPRITMSEGMRTDSTVGPR